MIYHFNVHIKDNIFTSKRLIYYRDVDGWILTYDIRNKTYGKIFEDYGYMYI